MPETTEKKSRGRPKEKASEKVDLDELKRLYSLGFKDTEIAWILGVSERTIYNWAEDPIFDAARKAGKLVADATVLETLKKLTQGYDYFEESVEKRLLPDGRSYTSQKRTKKHIPPNVVAIIFWLKNRLPDRWREKLQIEGILSKEPEAMNIKELTRELAEAFAKLDTKELAELNKTLAQAGITESDRTPGRQKNA